MEMIEWRPLHRRALDLTTAVVHAIGDDDLTRPTPCAGWDLRALLGHMTGQNDGFAQAVTGEAAEPAFAPRPVTGTGAAGWDDSAERVRSAFAAADPERPVLLPEISTEQRFPAWLVVGFHLLDTVVHGWDVATTLDRAHRPDDELVTASLGLARLVPDGPERLTPGAAFAPSRPGDTDDDWHRVLTLLGRTPRG